MLNYLDYVLNEGRASNIEVGKLVIICPKNYKNYFNCKGKVGIIEDIEKDGIKKTYTIKMQKQSENAKQSEWMVYDDKLSAYVDTMVLSKYQVTSLRVIDDEKFKLWKKGHLHPFECTLRFSRLLELIDFKIEMPFIDNLFVDTDPQSSGDATFYPASKYTGLNLNYYEQSVRQKIKIGRLLQKLNPTLDGNEIGEFVINYKAKYDEFNKNATERIQVVSGEDIRYYYYEKRYSKINTGSLGSSCMRYKDSQHRFDIYCDNPDVCALAIYLDEKGGLLARALIWKLDSGEVYMDRVYGASGEDERQLINYAEKLNMLSYNKLQNLNKPMTVTVKKDYGDSTENPYMDTFRYFKRDKNQLLNHVAITKVGGRFIDYNDHD